MQRHQAQIHIHCRGNHKDPNDLESSGRPSATDMSCRFLWAPSHQSGIEQSDREGFSGYYPNRNTTFLCSTPCRTLLAPPVPIPHPSANRNHHHPLACVTVRWNCFQKRGNRSSASLFHRQNCRANCCSCACGEAYHLHCTVWTYLPFQTHKLGLVYIRICQCSRAW